MPALGRWGAVAIWLAGASSCRSPGESWTAREPVSLTRLDCGGTGTPEDVAIFSDTHAFDGLKRVLVGSCYLVRHGSRSMLWDTGVDSDEKDEAGRPYARTTMAQQLATLGLAPEAVELVGISHSHPDHVGQVKSFSQATVLIGKGDAAELSGLKVEPVSGDRDIFGDGSVVMLATPGHTAGHHCLLVRLREVGPIILSGDLAVIRDGYELEQVPAFAADRAALLASLTRIKQLAVNLGATVVIQHDARDVALLPPFPTAAR